MNLNQELRFVDICGIRHEADSTLIERLRNQARAKLPILEV
ncbi:hypothetical protein C4J92_1456 [Pseudomonas sp. R3-18-08]|nr:hypothetical protein C4J92_1456 [Pseudomonas sp. R3-18-08]AZF46811.1 hypothetical protein C4J86_1562 [Pseudomonas sp. R2-7-07]AZF57322.1 hypothetical protein C4J84_1431 [Pseudomonas sp. R11-23-07]